MKNSLEKIRERIISFSEVEDDDYSYISGFYGQKEKLINAADFIETLKLHEYGDYYPFPSWNGKIIMECFDGVCDDILVSYDIYKREIKIETFTSIINELEFCIKVNDFSESKYAVFSFKYIMNRIYNDLKNESLDS